MDPKKTLLMLALATALVLSPAVSAQSGDDMMEDDNMDDGMMEDESNDSPGIGIVAALAGAAAVALMVRRRS